MTERRTWLGEGPVLADTSAWFAARRTPTAREAFLSAVERGDVAWCWPVRVELMLDARGTGGIESVDRTLEPLREIPVDRTVQRAVLALMRELAAGGSHGAHRFPLTDLTVAASAQAAGVGVLHNDAHFDRLADVAGVDAFWLAP